MDVETAIRALASAGHELPREAMRWALDNWDEAVPGMLGVLERFADGADRSEEAANAAFFILHLAGERRETRAFAPLRRQQAMRAIANLHLMRGGIGQPLPRPTVR